MIWKVIAGFWLQGNGRQNLADITKFSVDQEKHVKGVSLKLSLETKLYFVSKMLFQKTGFFPEEEEEEGDEGLGLG